MVWTNKYCFVSKFCYLLVLDMNPINSTVSYAPFFCFCATPVSDRDRMCPLELRPVVLGASEKEQRRGGGGAKGVLASAWVPMCSLLWVELDESRRLCFPRLPIARYSGPSSRSASTQSRLAGGAGEAGSVKEIWGIPASWLPVPHTHGAPWVLLDWTRS